MKIFDKLYAFTEKHTPLSSGFYTYHTPNGVIPQYRLHLRIEPDGDGVLIVNASTVLHLNQTATEMVYNLIQGKTDAENSKIISKRFKIDNQTSLQDVVLLHQQLNTLLSTNDLDPEVQNLFEPHFNVENISAPYRLDCYLREPNESSQPKLSLEVWKSILHKAYSAGIPHILFCGDEPTEVEWLPDLLTYAEELGLVTGLVSRGSKLTDNSYLTTLTNAGLDHLMVVFDPIDGKMREALSCVLPLDLYTSVGLIVRADIDHRPLIEWQDELGANAYSLIAHDEESIPSLQILAEDLAIREHRLVNDMPFPSEDRLSSGNMAESVEGHSYINLSVSPTGDVFADNTWSERLGSMLHDSFATIWSNRRLLA
jgi:hypothetical protein